MCGKGGKNEQHLMGIVILIVCDGYMVWALCNKRMKESKCVENEKFEDYVV